MNVFDYVKWRGDVPLSMDPFNEVDEILGHRRDSIRAAMAALRDLPDYKRRELRRLIRRLVKISRHERRMSYIGRLRSALQRHQ